MTSFQRPSESLNFILFRNGIPIELRNIVKSFFYQPLTNASIFAAVNDWCEEDTRDQAMLRHGGHISYWETSRVTYMQGLFEDCESFNDNINEWDVSNVKNMSRMFGNAYLYHQPLDKWDVRNVLDFSDMFWNAVCFNRPINT